MAPTTFDEFAENSRHYNALSVSEELLADALTPVGAFSNVVGQRDGFLFESAEHGERFSRFSFVGRSARATLISRGNGVEVVHGEVPSSIPLNDGVLNCLDALLHHYKAPVDSRLPPLHGGIVGYLGYDVVREVEQLGTVPTDDRQLPDAIVSIAGELVCLDHLNSRAILVDNVLLDGFAEEFDPQNSPALKKAYDESLARLSTLRSDLETPHAERLSSPPDRASRMDPALVHRVVSSSAYRDAVGAAKEYIKAGDAFQIVLSQRFDFELDVDPFDVYRVLRQVNPSPYMFFVRQGGVSVIGASPEPMVKLIDNKVISRPIAGTRPRGKTDEHDRQLAAELMEHPKEIAEHIMLVDLARNDVGRVAQFGTEVVDEFMTLERYSHVMHMTSQVTGTLREGLSPIDVLRATFPAGTVSGAPKVRAMQIIDELEITKRGPYAGVVGYFDFSGNLDTAIAIRTMVVDEKGHASVQAGAGIVVDSDPESEDLECENKSQAILSAVAGARKMAEERRQRASFTNDHS